MKYASRLLAGPSTLNQPKHKGAPPPDEREVLDAIAARSKNIAREQMRAKKTDLQTSTRIPSDGESND